VVLLVDNIFFIVGKIDDALGRTFATWVCGLWNRQNYKFSSFGFSHERRCVCILYYLSRWL